jgi:hypothetical protein
MTKTCPCPFPVAPVKPPAQPNPLGDVMMLARMDAIPKGNARHFRLPKPGRARVQAPPQG